MCHIMDIENTKWTALILEFYTQHTHQLIEKRKFFSMPFIVSYITLWDNLSIKT